MSNTLLIAIYCFCGILNGIAAGMNFSDGRKGFGFSYTIIALLWSSCAIIKVATL